MSPPGCFEEEIGWLVATLSTHTIHILIEKEERPVGMFLVGTVGVIVAFLHHES